MRPAIVVTALAGILATAAQAGGTPTQSASPVYRIDHVVDGDTVALRNGQRVRLVQIDTPEVYLGSECYGRAASRTTKTLLPVGSRVRLFAEPATDRVDQYGRLLRYVVRVNGAVNVNVRLVAIGAAAPYFYRGRRGRYASPTRSPRQDGRGRGSSASGEPVRTPLTIPTTASKRGAKRKGERMKTHAGAKAALVAVADHCGVRRAVCRRGQRQDSCAVEELQAVNARDIRTEWAGCGRETRRAARP